MSRTRHAVEFGPSFTGLGNRPSRTPAHQVDLLTGMMGFVGGSAFGSPMMSRSRKRPSPTRISGTFTIAPVQGHLVRCDSVLPWPNDPLEQLSRAKASFLA